MAVSWAALAAGIDGEVLRPGDADYDVARVPAIANYRGIRPAAVVRCAGPADVVEAIAFARRAGLPLAVRSGGHSFAGRSSSSGIVVDVSPMNSVTVSAGRAVVGAGARLGSVYDELSRRGVTIPAGCGPSVGVSGLTLGGGLGVLGRTYGLTCDSLRAAEVVLADGRVVVCDDEREPDLFWALRGTGGGTLGVVTSLVFATVPEPRTTAFHLTWSHHQAADVLTAWQSWSPAGPDELAASLLMTVSGSGSRQPVVNVFGSLIGTGSDAEALLEPFVAQVGTDPRSSVRHESSFRETKRYLSEELPVAAHAEEPPANGDMLSRSEFFRRSMPREAVARLVDNLTAGLVPGESRELDFSPWGGAYNRVAVDATAFAHRAERFLLKHATVIHPEATDAERAAARRWLEASYDTARPFGTGQVFPNFPEPGLDPWSPRHVGGNRDRLLQNSDAYDPDGLFGRGRDATASRRGAGSQSARE